jgi:hypothetical protein
MNGLVFLKGTRAVFFALVLCIVSALFLVNQGFAVVYRPPDPVMNYVPQYVGIYDTYYSYYVADDCRVCHGDRTAVAKRHQYTASAFTGCPDGCPLPSPDCLSACHTDLNDPETITDNCLTCHPAASYGGGGPHHETDMSGSGQCTSCHQPDLLVSLKSKKTFSYYPPSYLYTPTPVTCENCHWPSGDTPHTPPPDWPKPIEANEMVSSGVLHPSKAYKPINGTHDIIGGNVVAQCYFCHANTSDNPNWDPLSPIAIRYCENCHSKDSLHSIEEHVTAGHGLTSNEKCIACHGGMPADPLVLKPEPPAITSISPRFGPVGTSFSIGGENFGSSGSVLLNARMDETGKTYKISSGSCTLWTNGNIECAMPSGLAAGNYNVKVKTTKGKSNIRVFSLTETPGCIPCPTSIPIITKIKPTIGAPYALVTISGQNFGDRHTENRDVMITSPYGTVEAPIQSWKDTMIKFRIQPWQFIAGNVEVKVKTEEGESLTKNFEIFNEPNITSMDYSDMVNLTLTGSGFLATRLGVRADGYGWKSSVRISSPGKTITVGPKRITSWSDTEIRLNLPQLQTDTYGVTVKTIYFYDKNKDGKFTSGVDKVYQKIESDPKPLDKL